jgi:hypothetical protein
MRDHHVFGEEFFTIMAYKMFRRPRLRGRLFRFGSCGIKKVLE